MFLEVLMVVIVLVIVMDGETLLEVGWEAIAVGGSQREVEGDAPLSNSRSSITSIKVDEAMIEQKWAMGRKKTQTLIKWLFISVAG